MKQEILKLIEEKPKHFSILIKKDVNMFKWVLDNTLVQNPTSTSEQIYSAVHQISNICELGNIKKFSRFSTGYTGCGPAATCECTRKAISETMKETSKTVDHKLADQRRVKTNLEKTGFAYPSQNPKNKCKLGKNQINTAVKYNLLDKTWLDEQYNKSQKSASCIADELGIDYSTVICYCKLHGFSVRTASNMSTPERQISDYIRSMGFEVNQSVRGLIDGKLEIDIFVPDANLGIEVNGLYYHSCKSKEKEKNKKHYHISKSNMMNDAGMQLLHITDYEWYYKREIVKNLINTKLGLNDKIYARKCTLTEVHKTEEKEFLNTYHFQGYSPSIKCYGLYHNDELQMLLSIATSRFNNKYDYEVLRVCTTHGKNVVGGLSKLISAVKKEFPNKTFITYCDADKSNGNGYLSVGMTLERQTGPGFFWNDGNKKIVSRYSARKGSSWAKKNNIPFNKTQDETMYELKYMKYFDCGNYVFTFIS